jgi:long-chain acyl-CoA synthetase
MTVAAWHLAREVRARSKAQNVGILRPTSGMFPPALLATWMAGRTAVPLNYLLSRSDLEYIAKDAGLDAVIAVGPMLDVIGGPLPGLEVIRLVEMRFTGVPPVRFGHSAAPDETLVILYTSGTSGRPKGVMLSDRNLSANVEQVVDWAQFDHRDTMLGVLPQFHSFGLTVMTLLPLVVGCGAVYTARFIPGKLLELARKHRPTVFVAIPSMYNALLHAKKADAAALESLRYVVSGGEPLPDKVASGFLERFGKRINEGYGLTETSPCTNWCLPEEFRPHSVGRALPRVEERIVGPDGQLLGPNQDGEVRIKGPNVMKGYYNLPELTAKKAQETLDLAHITLNKNTVPFETRSPFQASGIRVGTPSITSRGFVESDMDEVAAVIDMVLKAIGTEGEAAALTAAKSRVAVVTAKYPLPYTL